MHNTLLDCSIADDASVDLRPTIAITKAHMKVRLTQILDARSWANIGNLLNDPGSFPNWKRVSKPEDCETK
jgi:hypothetical protein